MKFLTTDQLNKFFERNYTNTDIEVARGFTKKLGYSMKADYIDIVSMNRDERMGVEAIGRVYGGSGPTICRQFKKLAKMGLYSYINAPNVYLDTPAALAKEARINAKKKNTDYSLGMCVLAMAVDRNKTNLAAGAWL